MDGPRDCHYCCCCLVTKSCLTLGTPWTIRLPCSWDSPGKNTGVGCHVLLQGILPTQGSNSGLLHWQVVSLPVGHQKSLEIVILNEVSQAENERYCMVSLVCNIKKYNRQVNITKKKQTLRYREQIIGYWLGGRGNREVGGVGGTNYCV